MRVGNEHHSVMIKVNFGLPDYWRMFKKYGPRLPLAYFLEAHLFDLIHKTNTHMWLPKDCYGSKPENHDHGVHYMSSWTKEITKSFNILRMLVDDFSGFTFIDIGCGKGKVVLVWQKLLNKYKCKQNVFGIDYYEPLILLARSNHRVLFTGPGNFIWADATTVDFSCLGKKLIIYLYNPFDKNILGNVLQKLLSMDVFVIYNYPLHASTFLDHGFELIHHRSGFHPNSQTMIFRRNAMKPSDELV